jgi:uncharacterized lipoprotein YmbA
MRGKSATCRYGPINMTVYDLDASQTLSKKKGSQRQVQDLPRISVAEPLDRGVKYVIPLERPG